MPEQSPSAERPARSNVSLPPTERRSRRFAPATRSCSAGRVYTARDATHERLLAELDASGALPFGLEGQVLYYAGPTPAAPGQASRLGRAHDRQAHGCRHAETARGRHRRHDRQGRALRGGPARVRRVRRGVLRGRRRRGGPSRLARSKCDDRSRGTTSAPRRSSSWSSSDSRRSWPSTRWATTCTPRRRRGGARRRAVSASEPAAFGASARDDGEPDRGPMPRGRSSRSRASRAAASPRSSSCSLKRLELAGAPVRVAARAGRHGRRRGDPRRSCSTPSTSGSTLGPSSFSTRRVAPSSSPR